MLCSIYDLETLLVNKKNNNKIVIFIPYGNKITPMGSYLLIFGLYLGFIININQLIKRVN